jgi:hypothetical protein
MLANLLVGHKDVSKSLFNVWADIFQKPQRSRLSAWQQLLLTQNATRLASAAGIFATAASRSSVSQDPVLAAAALAPNSTVQEQHVQLQERMRIRSLYDSLQAHGEIERIIEGCHENLLNIRYLDPMMTKVLCNANAHAITRP